MRNSKGQTPEDIFFTDHDELFKMDADEAKGVEFDAIAYVYIAYNESFVVKCVYIVYNVTKAVRSGIIPREYFWGRG